MSKRKEKALNEKLNVKLPENLSKERLLEQLETVQQNEKIVEMPKKKNTAKRIVPIAASLAVVVGLLSAYFGMGFGDKINTESLESDKTEVMRYQSYDKIYDKFDTLRKEYKKDHKGDFLQSIFNFGNEMFLYSDDDVAEDMEGDMSSGSANDGSMKPEASEEFQTTPTDDEQSTEENKGRDHGTTNTQEEGVDEGDIIKTDGKYLYVANADKKTISIVDIAREEMKISAEILVEDGKEVKELYINENKLVVVGLYYDEERLYDDGFSVSDRAIYNTYYGAGRWANATFVEVYDIADRTAPKLVTEYSQQGGYDNSRMIGTKLYAVSTYYVDISHDDYRNYCIPETEINDVCKKVPADCISVVEESNSNVYAVITTLDVENGTEPSCEAILGNCNELYASAKGLFLSETNFDEQAQHFTKIYRFEYTDTGVNYKCMGKVAGYINDQFSMSYDGEHFRIATTLNKTEVDGDTVSMSVDNRVNNLYILNNNMQIVGKVEDLAQGESIESVRFVGDMAYVVTFRQTDPLFVIDLSDPENPTVKGELKIPGFSEYLHPIADGLLVGVGYDGTESGTNGDCKVSLFDVTNPYEPAESSVLTVSDGMAGCYPLVAENHKLYIKLSENEFAVPFRVYSYIEVGDYLKNKTHVSYIRYRLTGNELCEVTRYNIKDMDSNILGATYVENTFYVVVNEYDYYNQDNTYIVAYDLTTNKEIGRLQTVE